jgi:hypothetical protein
MGKGKTKTRVRPSALVRAEHGGKPVHLTTPQKRVLDEALRLGADLADEIESKTMSYGRWLLESVFDSDATKALDEKTQNPIWLEIVRRAGGPTLRVSRRMVYVALQLAAFDKRITDQTWRGLDAGRKEILLPLDDDKRLRQAAEHVAKFNLTQAKTREYVSELMTKNGAPPRARITGPVLTGRIRKFREALGSTAVLRRVRALKAELESSEVEPIIGEIEKLREVLKSVSRELKGT